MKVYFFHAYFQFRSSLCCCCCSAARSCPILWGPMDCSRLGSPVLHYLQEFAQTHVHWVNQVIQTSHRLSPLLFLPSIFSSIKVFFNGSALHIRQPNFGASASASALSMNIQGWFPLGLTGLIYLLSKRLSRVFSSTIIQKHQFFSAQLSLQSNSYIHPWLLEKP